MLIHAGSGLAVNSWAARDSAPWGKAPTAQQGAHMVWTWTKDGWPLYTSRRNAFEAGLAPIPEARPGAKLVLNPPWNWLYYPPRNPSDPRGAIFLCCGGGGEWKIMTSQNPIWQLLAMQTPTAPVDLRRKPA